MSVGHSIPERRLAEGGVVQTGWTSIGRLIVGYGRELGSPASIGRTVRHRRPLLELDWTLKATFVSEQSILAVQASSRGAVSRRAGVSEKRRILNTLLPKEDEVKAKKGRGIAVRSCSPGRHSK
ncbi:hypothetical protein EYF80_032213 [Liparis tanakae]|uniref:Uncharacterized protein n=1 Tax=Liparis tanakae TaxID=230148 RepID=A0A4Z2GWF1_9TELE|nr:hypothetical protein EYF80_032213 [Liparis tanakae]